MTFPLRRGTITAQVVVVQRFGEDGKEARQVRRDGSPWPHRDGLKWPHGENDLLVRPSDAREFVERTRARSSHTAEYVELPGGHHDFDLYESIRSNAISFAVERFITSSGRERTEST